MTGCQKKAQNMSWPPKAGKNLDFGESFQVFLKLFEVLRFLKFFLG